jgi:hypothetical protein
MDLLHRLELLRCTRLLRGAPDSLLKELAEGCESKCFAEAAGLFDSCSDGLADRSAVTLARHCRKRLSKSPEGWDGVFTLAAK